MTRRGRFGDKNRRRPDESTATGAIRSARPSTCSNRSPAGASGRRRHRRLPSRPLPERPQPPATVRRLLLGRAGRSVAPARTHLGARPSPPRRRVPFPTPVAALGPSDRGLPLPASDGSLDDHEVASPLVAARVHRRRHRSGGERGHAADPVGGQPRLAEARRGRSSSPGPRGGARSIDRYAVLPTTGAMAVIPLRRDRDRVRQSRRSVEALLTVGGPDR